MGLIRASLPCQTLRYQLQIRVRDTNPYLYQILLPSQRGEVSIPIRRWTVFGLADQQCLSLLKLQEAGSFIVNFIILPVLTFGQDTL